MSELLYNFLLFATLVLLILFLQILSRLGLFDPIRSDRTIIPALLIATTPHHTPPRSHPLMYSVASLAAQRGVEEEPPIITDDDPPITRGCLLGVYFAAPTHFRKPSRAAVGVVLDVGENRVNMQTKAEWQQRLDAAALQAAGPAGSPLPVEVRILRLSDSLHARARDTRETSPSVAHWRLMRKLMRKRKVAVGDGGGSGFGDGGADMFVQAWSRRHETLVAALPFATRRRIWGE